MQSYFARDNLILHSRPPFSAGVFLQKFFSYFYARVFHLPRRDAWHLAVDGKGRLRSKNLNSARNPDFPPRFRHAVFARRWNPRFCLYASGGEFQADRDNQASHIFSGKKESEARKKARGSKRRSMRRHIGNLRDCGGGRRAHCAYGGRFRQGTAIRRISRISCGFEKAEVNGEIAPALREMRRRCGNLPSFRSCGGNGFGASRHAVNF